VTWDNQAPITRLYAMDDIRLLHHTTTQATSRFERQASVENCRMGIGIGWRRQRAATFISFKLFLVRQAHHERAKIALTLRFIEGFA
jgi:hypothetical protein